MPAQGTLNANSLTVARITVDLLQQTPSVHALAALINSKTGKSMAWAEGEGGVWSNATMEKLKDLRESMEEDMAKALFLEHATERTDSGNRGLQTGGLGEHLEGAVDAPSV